MRINNSVRLGLCVILVWGQMISPRLQTIETSKGYEGSTLSPELHLSTVALQQAYLQAHSRQRDSEDVNGQDYSVLLLFKDYFDTNHATIAKIQAAFGRAEELDNNGNDLLLKTNKKSLTPQEKDNSRKTVRKSYGNARKLLTQVLPEIENYQAEMLSKDQSAETQGIDRGKIERLYFIFYFENLRFLLHESKVSPSPQESLKLFDEAFACIEKLPDVPELRNEFSLIYTIADTYRRNFECVVQLFAGKQVTWFKQYDQRIAKAIEFMKRNEALFGLSPDREVSAKTADELSPAAISAFHRAIFYNSLVSLLKSKVSLLVAQNDGEEALRVYDQAQRYAQWLIDNGWSQQFRSTVEPLYLNYLQHLHAVATVVEKNVSASKDPMPEDRRAVRDLRTKVGVLADMAARVFYQDETEEEKLRPDYHYRLGNRVENIAALVEIWLQRADAALAREQGIERASRELDKAYPAIDLLLAISSNNPYHELVIARTALEYYQQKMTLLKKLNASYDILSQDFPLIRYFSTAEFGALAELLRSDEMQSSLRSLKENPDDYEVESRIGNAIQAGNTLMPRIKKHFEQAREIANNKEFQVTEREFVLGPHRVPFWIANRLGLNLALAELRLVNAEGGIPDYKGATECLLEAAQSDRFAKTDSFWGNNLQTLALLYERNPQQIKQLVANLLNSKAVGYKFAQYFRDFQTQLPVDMQLILQDVFSQRLVVEIRRSDIVQLADKFGITITVPEIGVQKTEKEEVRRKSPEELRKIFQTAAETARKPVKKPKKGSIDKLVKSNMQRFVDAARPLASYIQSTIETGATADLETMRYVQEEIAAVLSQLEAAGQWNHMLGIMERIEHSDNADWLVDMAAKVSANADAILEKGNRLKSYLYSWDKFENVYGEALRAVRGIPGMHIAFAEKLKKFEESQQLFSKVWGDNEILLERPRGIERMRMAREQADNTIEEIERKFNSATEANLSKWAKAAAREIEKMRQEISRIERVDLLTISDVGERAETRLKQIKRLTELSAQELPAFDRERWGVTADVYETAAEPLLQELREVKEKIHGQLEEIALLGTLIKIELQDRGKRLQFTYAGSQWQSAAVDALFKNQKGEAWFLIFHFFLSTPDIAEDYVSVPITGLDDNNSLRSFVDVARREVLNDGVIQLGRQYFQLEAISKKNTTELQTSTPWRRIIGALTLIYKGFGYVNTAKKAKDGEFATKTQYGSLMQPLKEAADRVLYSYNDTLEEFATLGAGTLRFELTEKDQLYINIDDPARIHSVRSEFEEVMRQAFSANPGLQVLVSPPGTPEARELLQIIEQARTTRTASVAASTGEAVIPAASQSPVVREDLVGAAI